MRRILLLLLVLVTALSAAAAGYWFLVIPAVVARPPVYGPAIAAVYATGIVEPVTWAKVTPFVGGRIVDLCKCEGKAVRTGDVLAKFDDDEQRARLTELEARSHFLKKDLDRYRELLASRFTSPQAYERIASQYEELRSAIAVERERLSEYVLRAPIDGVVLRRDGEVGEIVQPGDVLFWVGRPKPLWIVAEVDEEDIPQVAVGMPVLIKADAFAERVFDGTVAEITPKGDPVNKTYRVRVSLPQDTPLLIGMTTEVNVVVRRVDRTLLVPVDAVRGGRVYLLRDGRVAARTVTTGIAGIDRIEVITGLSADDLVIDRPPAGLADGDRVRASAAAAGP